MRPDDDEIDLRLLGGTDDLLRWITEVMQRRWHREGEDLRIRDRDARRLGLGHEANDERVP